MYELYYYIIQLYKKGFYNFIYLLLLFLILGTPFPLFALKREAEFFKNPGRQSSNYGPVGHAYYTKTFVVCHPGTILVYYYTKCLCY